MICREGMWGPHICVQTHSHTHTHIHTHTHTLTHTHLKCCCVNNSFFQRACLGLPNRSSSQAPGHRALNMPQGRPRILTSPAQAPEQWVPTNWAFSQKKGHENSSSLCSGGRSTLDGGAQVGSQALPPFMPCDSSSPPRPCGQNLPCSSTTTPTSQLPPPHLHARTPGQSSPAFHGSGSPI